VATLGPEGTPFPAFYTPDSGLKSPNVICTVKEVANLILAQKEMNLKSGIVIAVPIPKEHAAYDVQVAILQALEEAKQSDIKGPNVTPFLLSKVSTLTKGNSLEANLRLIENNARVGAQIAVQLSKQSKSKILSKPLINESMSKLSAQTRSYHFHAKRDFPLVQTRNSGPVGYNLCTKRRYSKHVSTVSKRPYIFGASALDITSTLHEPWASGDPSSSYKGKVVQTPGGVARNIAETMHRLHASPKLISAVGTDFAGNTLLNHFSQIGMCASGVEKIQTSRTATYSAFHKQSGELVVAVADMELPCSMTISDNVLESHVKQASIAVLDGNLSEDLFSKISVLASAYDVPLIFEPTSVPKAMKMPWLTIPKSLDFCITPNIYEAQRMSERLPYSAEVRDNVIAWIEQVRNTLWMGSLRQHVPLVNALIHGVLLGHHVPQVLIKCGELGVLFVTRKKELHESPFLMFSPRGESTEIAVTWVRPPRVITNATSVTGAGDSAVGALAVAWSTELSMNAARMSNYLEKIQAVAAQSLLSEFAVSPDLTPATLFD
jgi:pseudouridine-5'-phosphate glycosidase/pseudouridine kinase